MNTSLAIHGGSTAAGGEATPLFTGGTGSAYTLRDHPGWAYPTGTWRDLVAMAHNPPSVPKDEGAWAIFSTYNGHRARSHSTQHAQGGFTALWADIDSGDPSQAKVAGATDDALGGGVEFLVYHTASTGAQRPDGSTKEKHRVVVPLHEPIDGETWVAAQIAFIDALAERGIEADYAAARPAQLCFLPNRGLRYDEPYHNPGASLSNPFPERVAVVLEERRAARAEAEAKRAALPTEAHGPRSYIAAFMRAHPTCDLLYRYGFTTQNGVDWHHPDQSAGSYATRLHDDGTLFTLSATVGSMGGVEAGIGRFFGSGLDIMAFHERWTPEQAEAYARKCLADEDAALLAATTVAGKPLSFWVGNPDSDVLAALAIDGVPPGHLVTVFYNGRRTFEEAVAIHQRDYHYTMDPEDLERARAAWDYCVRVNALSIIDTDNRELSVEAQIDPTVQKIVQDRISTVLPGFDCSKLTMPPGFAGRMAKELAESLLNPYPEYVIPSVLFGLNTLFSRKYKNDDKPITLFHLVTGNSYTGKSFACSNLKRFIQRAVAPTFIPANLYSGAFKSAQRFHRSVCDHGTHGTVVDESGAMLKLLFDESSLGDDMQLYVRLAYDAAKADGELISPQSQQGAKDGLRIVYNAAIPMYLTCTQDELERMQLAQLVNGTWNRFIIAFCDFPVEEAENDEDSLRKDFSPEIAERLCWWQANAAELDRAMRPDAKNREEDEVYTTMSMSTLLEVERDLLVSVKWEPEAKAAKNRISNRLKTTTGEAQAGKHDKWFEILARTDENIQRVACTLACADMHNGDWRVTMEHLRWAASYVLHMTSRLLTAQLQGKVAVSLDNLPSVIAGKVSKLGARHGNYVTERDLWQQCRYMFGKSAKELRREPREVFKKTLAQMVEDGLLRKETKLESYSVQVVTANEDHKYWKAQK